MEEKSKTPSYDELSKLYTDGESCDKDIFSEMRSNILLCAGDYFSKKNAKWWSRIRTAKDVPSEQKVRLSKNHLHRISRTYVNNIISQSPGVMPTPNNPKELQDQKAAELNKSVWEYAKYQNHLKMKTQSWCKDFIEIGEVATKIYWNPMAGRFIGYEQQVDVNEQPMIDEAGAPVSTGKAVFSGDLEFEPVYGFNLIRPSSAKTMREAPWLCIRKMVGVDELKAMVGDDEDKVKSIQASRDETFFVFDGSKSEYKQSKDQTMLKEFYFRPCYDYPHGWYSIVACGKIMFEGELPYGIFPICYEGFDEIQTTPRHRSIIKQLRPYAAEVSRSASKMAEHQVTLGDDKIILQNGSKMTTGPQLPGIRSLFVSGQAPTILEGRTGAQYLDYMNSQIAEMYQVANLDYDSAEKEGGQDAYANLFRSMREKKKFSIYAEKFEAFLVQVCDIYLQLAKQYFDANMLIPQIGKSEYINIDEFKSQEKLCYQIKIEPVSDDMTSMMGRTLQLNHLVQYAGSQMAPDQLGRIIRNMPFANTEEIYRDLTLDDDTATNIMLMIERGQMPSPHKNDNGDYILKRMAARQKQSDYYLLSPQTQAMYDQTMQYYEQIEAQRAMEIKQAQSEFIPAGGALLAVDYYVPDPNNKTRTIRARVPAEAIDWLIKHLESQGSTQSQIAQQTTGVQSDLARMLQQNGQAGAGMPMPNQMGPQGSGGLLQ